MCRQSPFKGLPNKYKLKHTDRFKQIDPHNARLSTHLRLPLSANDPSPSVTKIPSGVHSTSGIR